MQMRMPNFAGAAAAAGERLPKDYRRSFWGWFTFDIPAFAAVLAISG
jgi:uncharacterized membrane protein